MSVSLHRRALIFCLCAFVGMASLQIALAQDDAVHAISGIVKHVDKGTKTVVVKAADGTEHTIKWTDKTTWEGTKESGKGIKEGSKLSVKYTEDAGEKTAVGVKDISKDAAKAVK